MMASTPIIAAEETSAPRAENYVMRSLNGDPRPNNEGDDVRTKPELYFQEWNEAPDSLSLLPPPPDVDSLAFLVDKAYYEKGLLLRKTPRGAQASSDSDIGPEDLPAAFSTAFSCDISKKETPEIYKLLSRVSGSAGDLATRAAKRYYNRIRPFAYYDTPTCNTKDMKRLSSNGSYPSGHTSIGWTEALVLAEINPARKNEILKRGYEFGESRIICGFHWKSDVDAARIVASAEYSSLQSNTAFIKQMSLAKKEFAESCQAKK